ncbi:MAG TPA: phospholipase [Thermoanaerobaculia bacterium]|nr:phospholipase [Thermoanaerobaculia bacterium]
MKQSFSGQLISRRALLAAGGSTLAAWMASACHKEGFDMQHQDSTTEEQTQSHTQGRLRSRPGTPTASAAPGLHRLGFGGRRDGLLYVPAGYRADRPAPLVALFHGAGGNAEHGLAPLRPFADEAGLLLLATDSRVGTWDVIRGGYGPDVAFLDRALAHTFERCAVDPERIAAGGFSDGASYALSIAVTNGDLFRHVLAFSPGFLAPAGTRGTPRFFLSHGTRDEVLPIQSCSRRIVPRLRGAGYDVLYREFDGPHTVPPGIVREALSWFGAPVR